MQIIGEEGAQGIQGPQGNQGAQGAQGTQGAIGSTGAIGLDGTNGTLFFWNSGEINSPFTTPVYLLWSDFDINIFLGETTMSTSNPSTITRLTVNTNQPVGQGATLDITVYVNNAATLLQILGHTGTTSASVSGAVPVSDTGRIAVRIDSSSTTIDDGLVVMASISVTTP